MRVELDDRVDVSFGRRATDWELKGVPVRLEVGPRDLAEGVVTLVRRIVGGDARRRSPLDGVADAVADELDAEQAALLAEATARRERAPPTSRPLDEAARSRRRPAGPASRGPRSAPRARPSSRRRRVRALPASAPTARCPTSDDEPDLVARRAAASVLRPWRDLPDPAAGVADAGQADARAARAAASWRPALRAEVGRLPLHRVPRRRRRRDRQPQREAAHPLLPRARRPAARRTCPSGASSTARS